MTTQQLQILRDSTLSKNAMGYNQTIQAYKDDSNSKFANLNARWNGLLVNLGISVMPLAIRALEKLNPMISSMALWVDKNRESVKSFGYALLGLSGFLIGGGLVNMIIAAGRGFQILGSALLMNPIGLTIAGIAAVGFFLWNNWKEISSSLKLVWGDMKTMFIKLFQGDIIGAFKSFALAFLTGWQTVFNTLIAGVNLVLPASMQISKTTFADDIRGKPVQPAIAASAAPWAILPTLTATNTQPLVAPVPAKQSLTVQLTQPIHLDGKKIAESVTTHQAKEAARPRTGTQGFDPSRSLLMPGSPSAVYPRG